MKIVLVGEAWGEQEARYKTPFVGKSGEALYRMLCEADFPLEPIVQRFVSPNRMRDLWERSGIPLLNVFNLRPPDPKNKNRSTYFFDKKNGDIDPGFGPRSSGEYVLNKYAPHVHKLRADLAQMKPNLIVALGNTALWALTGLTKISAERGTLHDTPYGKLLPTYHPAAILRKWDDRVIAVADLIKARSEMNHAGIKIVPREIWAEPELHDLYSFWDQHLSKSSMIAIDSETERTSVISEVGFASDPYHAIHIPFTIVNRTPQGRAVSWNSYWPTQSQEISAWKFVRKVCESPIPKVLQNGIYDIYWLYKRMHIRVRNPAEDTMLLHHALQPEMQKALGFQGSVYTTNPAWKHLRRESNKADE